MKQVVEDPRSGSITVIDVPAPRARPGGCLVRTVASAVSTGTERAAVAFGKRSLVGKAMARPDLVARVRAKAKTDGVKAAYEAARTRLASPLPLGYSSAARVLASDDARFEVGDLVACAGGGYASHAEVAWIPRNLVAAVPDGVSPHDAAFAAVASVALHGVHRAGATGGMRVGVIGLGLIGGMTVQILRAYGCSVLGVDVADAALEAARAQGADAVAAPADAAAATARLTDGAGLDAVIVTAAGDGARIMEAAGEMTRPGGTVCIVGDVPLTLPRRLYYERELNVVVSRSYGFGRYDPSYEEEGVDYPMAHARWTIGRNLEEVLRLMAEGKLQIEGLVSARFEVDRAPEAYEAIVEGSLRGGALFTYPGPVDAPVDRRVTYPDAAPAAAAGAPGVAVIGAGLFATSTLLPAFAATGPWRLRGVASQGGLSASQAARQHGFAFATTDVDEIYASDADLVVVATRHDQHAPLAAAALRRGKDVFVEKPLALDEEGLRQVAVAAVAARRRLQVGFNRRFAPLVQTLRENFADADGVLSMNLTVNAGALPADHWVRRQDEGGGRVLAEVCHFVDLAAHIARSEVASVTAVAGEAPGGPDDHVIAQLTFRNGATAVIRYLGFGPSGWPKEAIEVFGPDRAAFLDNFRKLTVARGARTRTWRGRGQDKGHRAQLAALRDAVVKGQPSPTSLTSLVATTLATFAVQRALTTRALVEVPPAAQWLAAAEPAEEKA